MRKKLIALLLCFVMIVSTGLFTSFVAAADESSQSSEDEQEIILEGSQEIIGMAFEEEEFEINLEEPNPFQLEGETEQEEDPILDLETGDVDDSLENPIRENLDLENKLGDEEENFSLEMSLYEKFMACETLEDLDAVFSIVSDEDWNNFTDEERIAITDLILALKQAPTSEVVLIESEPPVKSEIVIPIVDFINVAPFKDAVVGGN